MLISGSIVLYNEISEIQGIPIVFVINVLEWHKSLAQDNQIPGPYWYRTMSNPQYIDT